MSIAKIILNGVTQMDLTQDTVTSASHIVSGHTGHLANGDQAAGTGVVPSGTIQITENGPVDVSSYASAEVDVSGGDADVIDKYNDLITGNNIPSVVNLTGTLIQSGLFNKSTTITEVYAPNVTDINYLGYNGGNSKTSCFYMCSRLTTAYFPQLKTLGDGMFRSCSSLVNLTIPNITDISYSNGLYGCNKLTTIVFTKLSAKNVGTGVFSACTALTAVDLTAPSLQFNGQRVFYGSTKLATLILRVGSVVPLSYINNFGSTPFDSGGAGGTIYIPKALYDELGTGSSLDYKAATNWSTIDGYGTVTWAAIEGSQYENYYADGTAVTS